MATLKPGDRVRYNATPAGKTGSFNRHGDTGVISQSVADTVLVVWDNAKSASWHLAEYLDKIDPPLDLTKPVQTRDGRPVRILCTDRAPHPRQPKSTVFGLITCPDGSEQGYHWEPNGSFGDLPTYRSWDLVQAPEPVVEQTFRARLVRNERNKRVKLYLGSGAIIPYRHTVLADMTYTIKAGQGMGEGV